jgi:hypothetical protein
MLANARDRPAKASVCVQAPRSLVNPALSSATGVNSQLKPNTVPNWTTTERQTVMNAIDPGLSDLPGPRCRQILDLSGPIPLVDGIPVYPIFGSQLVGGRMGIHAAADVLSANTLVSQLADGLSLDELWLEFSKF